MTIRKVRPWHVMLFVVLITVVVILFSDSIYSVTFDTPALRDELISVFSSSPLIVEHVEFQLGTEGGGAGLEDSSLTDAIQRLENDIRAQNEHLRQNVPPSDLFGEPATTAYLNELAQNRALLDTEGLRYPRVHVMGNIIDVLKVRTKNPQISFAYDVCRSILIRILPLNSCGS